MRIIDEIKNGEKVQLIEADDGHCYLKRFDANGKDRGSLHRTTRGIEYGAKY